MCGVLYIPQMLWASLAFSLRDILLLTPPGDIVMTIVICPPCSWRKAQGSIPHYLKHQHQSLCPHLFPPATPVPWISQKSGGLRCYQEERLMVYVCLLVVVSLLMGCTGLAVTLIKCE